jgi:hypothetical protein
LDSVLRSSLCRRLILPSSADISNDRLSIPPLRSPFLAAVRFFAEWNDFTSNVKIRRQCPWFGCRLCQCELRGSTWVRGEECRWSSKSSFRFRVKEWIEQLNSLWFQGDAGDSNSLLNPVHSLPFECQLS